MKEYRIKTASGETTVLLTDEAAKQRGLTSADEVKPAPVRAKAKTVPNKSRRAANKGNA